MKVHNLTYIIVNGILTRFEGFSIAKYMPEGIKGKVRDYTECCLREETGDDNY